MTLIWKKNHTAVIRISDIWAQASLSHYINKKCCMSCSVIRIWFPHVALQDDIIKMWLYFYIFWFNCQHEHRSTNELNYRCESNPKSIQQQYLSMIINRYLNIWLQQHELCESCESRSVTLKLLKTSKFCYLPQSAGDTTCLLGSVLPPLLWRRALPRDRPRPGGKECSTGACSDECESFWPDCQRSPEFAHLEPLLEEIIYECQPVIIQTEIQTASQLSHVGW